MEIPPQVKLLKREDPGCKGVTSTTNLVVYDLHFDAHGDEAHSSSDALSGEAQSSDAHCDKVHTCDTQHDKV